MIALQLQFILFYFILTYFSYFYNQDQCDNNIKRLQPLARSSFFRCYAEVKLDEIQLV